MIPDKLAFLDIETTGGRLRTDRILEIGILRVENGVLTKTLNTVLNPQTYISPFIETLTNIHQQDWENAPSFREIKQDIVDILKDCILVAHNVRFDYGFLKKEFNLLEHSFSMKHFCTVKLSRYLYPKFKHHNLDAVIQRHGFTCANRHRAFDDAKVLWDFFQYVQTQFDQEYVEKALQFVMKRTSVPIGLSNEDIDGLPESPGVYIFYGDTNMPLYVGKSINIKDRVLSHFSSDHSSPIEMNIAQQVKRIETIKTAGELGALCKESMLVKEMQPLLNRKLRRKQLLVSLRQTTNADGYHCAKIETVDAISPDEMKEIIGIFRSKKQAEDFLFTTAKQYNLCHKLLNIEKTKTGCFMYRLGECQGACLKKELHLRYNMRFIQAFSHNKIKPWPFNGPIMIEESDDKQQLTEIFLIDKWCYLGSYKKDEGITEDILHQEYVFDLDLYKILKRYLLTEGNYKYIKELNSKQYQNIPMYNL